MKQRRLKEDSDLYKRLAKIKAPHEELSIGVEITGQWFRVGE